MAEAQPDHKNNTKKFNWEMFNICHNCNPEEVFIMHNYKILKCTNTGITTQKTEMQYLYWQFKAMV